MSNEIFALDKELNFGIYKIFKQSKNYIGRLLNEIAQIKDSDTKEHIYNYLYNFFSLYYEGGDFGYTKRAFATFIISYVHKEYQIDEKEKCSFDSSHSFFYDGEETKFTWRTEDSYYIKSNKYFNNLTITIDDIDIIFKVEGIDEGFDSKKGRLFRLLRATKNRDKLTLYFNISNKQTPKFAIYSFTRNIIDKDIDELEYVPSENFEKDSKLNDLFNDVEFDKYKKYLFVNKKAIFKDKSSKEEEKTQIHSSKLYLSKKEYANKVYNKTEAKKLLDVDKFDFENKGDIEKLYKEDRLLNFFFRLDRGFNNFITGIDSDYFIHKNLKRFLLTEMDKFIKNYILHDTQALLSKEGEKLRERALLFKEKAEKIIEFLAAVEEFQKYIWEKRKLIQRVEYIISSNKIEDQELLNEVLNNHKQIDEWKELGLCKQEPSIDELQSHPYPIDTKHFDEDFKYKILAQFDNIEEEIDGILIKSENYQALKFLEKRFKNQIKCIYIDPPYNTGNDGFVYKDNYQEASWLSMMNDRLRLTKNLMRSDGVIFTQIDEKESANLKQLKNMVFKEENHAATLHVQMSTVQGQKVGAAKEGNIVKNAEYIYVYSMNGKKNIAKNPLYDPTDYDTHYNKFITEIEQGVYKEENLSDVIARDASLKQHLQAIGLINQQGKITNKGIAKAYKVSEIFREWIHGHMNNIATDHNVQGINVSDALIKELKEGEIVEVHIGKRKYLLTKNSKGNIRQRIRLNEKIRQCHDFNRTYGISTIRGDWWGGFYKDMGNVSKEDNVIFPNGKKASRLIEQLIYMTTSKDGKEWVLDFFAGSGTTPAVAYKMNKRFIAVEMNDYFDDLTLKRMKYSMFGNSEGIESQKSGGLVQYLYLQQYEDLIEHLDIATKDINIEAKYIFNPLKNRINKVEVKNDLSTLWNFVYHRGLKLKHIEKKDSLLIGECEEGVIILGDSGKTLEDIVKLYVDTKIYTNLKPKNNINYNTNTIEIISSADFKGI